MITTLELTYNPQDAVDYLKTLQTEYEHYHWYYVKDHNDLRSLGNHFSLKTMHGYGLQTIYGDLTFPYHCDIDPHDEGPEYFKDTALVFGFFKNIKDNFNDVFRSFVMTFEPGDYIGKWTAGVKPHTRIFIPLVTNGTDWLRAYDSNGYYNVIPEVGKIYTIDMLDNTSYANIVNEGNANISFIMFSTL